MSGVCVGLFVDFRLSVLVRSCLFLFLVHSPVAIALALAVGDGLVVGRPVLFALAPLAR